MGLGTRGRHCSLALWQPELKLLYVSKTAHCLLVNVHHQLHLSSTYDMPGTVLGTGHMMNAKTDILGLCSWTSKLVRIISPWGTSPLCPHSTWHVKDISLAWVLSFESVPSCVHHLSNIVLEGQIKIPFGKMGFLKHGRDWSYLLINLPLLISLPGGGRPRGSLMDIPGHHDLSHH